MNKRTLLLTIFIILIIALFGINYIVNAKTSSTIIMTECAINKINEDYFDISFNINEKIAIVDGKEVNITDLFFISEEYLDKLISNNTFETFISENLIGDIEYNNDTISVTNPYSTNTLIVNALDESVFNNYDEIISVEEIVEDTYLINYKNALDTKQGYEELQKDKTISSVITDYKISISDTMVQEQSVSDENLAWGVEATGLDTYITKLDYMNTDGEIIIAVLDSGVNTSHEVFSEDKIILTNSYDYVNNDSDISDDNGHGTQVAGVIAESTPDNIKILPIKVMDSSGNGYLSNILEAIEDVNQYVDVINLSLGVATSKITSSDLEILESFFKEIYDSGTIVVCAAGNSNANVFYPASSEYTISASAIDSNKNRASFSNYGEEIDFALPGVSLILPYYTGNNVYITNSGTSFSSPFLASAVALIKSEYGYTQINDVVNVLKDNAEDLGDEGKDIYFGYGSINFDTNMFKNPVIVRAETIDTEWSKENTIVAYAVSSTNIKSYAITTSVTTPSVWTDFSSSATNVKFETKTNTNGTNYIWIKDENNNIVNKTVDVQYVDNTAPIINDFCSSNITNSKFTLQLSLEEASSGLSKIKWYYKKAEDTKYTEIIDTLEGQTSNYVKTHEFSDLEDCTDYIIYAEVYDIVGNYTTSNPITVTTLKNQNPSVSYRSHIQNIGWESSWTYNGGTSGTVGKCLRLEGLQVCLHNKPYEGTVTYRSHVQNTGWESTWRTDSQVSGSVGKSLRVEAIQIKLTGEMAEHYDIYYRLQIQDYGWLGWAKNGQSAGSEGHSKKVEAIEIKLVKKGEAAPGSTDRRFVRASGLKYRSHVQNIGWMSYVDEKGLSGTTGKGLRVEAFQLLLTTNQYDGGIKYRGYIQNNGWESWKYDKEESGTNGKGLRMEAFQIELYGDVANYYDVYYRVHVQNIGWMGWAKNGESAGTSGYGYRIESFQIQLVDKGEAAPGSTSDCFRSK